MIVILRLLLFLVVLLATSASAQQNLNSLYEPQVFDGMPCRIMKPLGFDTKQKYPVIVSLHGAGGRGTENNKQLKDWNRQLAEPQRRKDFPCYVVAPQANELWNADYFRKTKALIETLPAVDNDRIYIMGHSMGGHGTYIFIQLDSDYFAAAAPSAGAGRRSTEEFIEPEKIRDIPIWAFHGDRDGVCPYERDREVFRKLSQIGGNMKLTTWLGDNHGVSGKMVPGASNGKTEFSSDRCDQQEDFMTWLFSQSREFDEFDRQAGEVQDLIERLGETPGLETTKQEAVYLRKTVSDIRHLRNIRGALLGMPAGAAKEQRKRLQKQAELLLSRIEADEELIEMIAGVIEADENEIEDLEVEVAEFREELEALREKSPVKSSPELPQARTKVERLQSGEYFVTQSWSQERNFRRPYYVNVPESAASSRKLPVFVFLHGNGGSATNAMRGWLRSKRRIASRYIMVFAQGYRESWNIVSERSKADDLGFIESIVKRLAEYPNVSANDFTIMGNSNGAALVNQLAIESRLPNIRNYISGVSPLNVWQYDGKSFKAKGDDNNYRKATVPMTSKRLLNISGTDDRLVPYTGGASRVIPAKDGKLAFLHAEESTFLWAKAMGYRGARLSRPGRVDDNLSVFSYLNGDVVHYRVSGEGHGAASAIDETTLLQFLEGK